MLARRPFFVLFASCALLALPHGVAARPEAAAIPSAAPSAVASELPLPTPIASIAPGVPSSPAPGETPSAPQAPGTAGTAGRNAATTSALNAFANSLARAAAPVPYATFVRGAQAQPGVVDLLQKEDDLYLDLSSEALGKTFLIAPVLATSIAGDAEAFTGRGYEPLIVRFQRVGRRILWIEPNENYSAPADSPAARSLAVSVTDSVINATPIVAEDEATKRVVVSANFFLTDFENIGRDLGGRSAPTLLLFGSTTRPGYTVDAARSYFERVKALPANDEILASLAFTGQEADQPPVADSRNVRVRVHYSIVEAPALGSYRPRFADDRVGYFVETQKRLGEDLPYPPFVRYIDRRDVSKGPIVYYLSDEIPHEYRETIRSAVLAWNDAFARIGMPGEVQVRDAPTDGSFDPDDIRYSTIRWVTGEGSARIAFAQVIADPRTGQILRGPVVIDGETIAAFARGYGLTARPLRDPSSARAAASACTDGRCLDSDDDQISSASLGLLAMRSRGVPLPQRLAYVRAYLRYTVMHEIGHTLGLSHNFAGSSLYSLAQLHDPAFTARHQLSSSVMDYLPVNLSPPGTRQAAYFQDQIGAYDRWAIRYGYERLPFATPAGERPALAALASESTRPEYAFESDADAGGPQAIDPRVNRYDLSNEPLAYARNQFAIDDRLLADLDRSLPRDDASYGDERVAFATQVSDYARAAAIVGRFVGGAYVSRDHRGQPGGKPPIAPVPRAVSAQAFAMLDRQLFSSGALRLSPKLLSDLGYDRFGGWGDVASRPDYPAVELLARLQDSVLVEQLLAPETASRLEEAEYRERAPGETMTLHDLFAWLQRGVFDDLGPSVRSTGVVHRGLQRRYAGYLTELALAPSALIAAVGYPGDVPALARQALTETAAAPDRSLRTSRLDDTTRAHRADLSARIHRALNPVAEGQP